jgi:hypothetical protein
MFKKKNPYEGNKKITEDNNTYTDKNTIALINLIAEIVVEATLANAPKPADDRPRHTSEKSDR